LNTKVTACIAGIVAAAILGLVVYLTRYEYFSLALGDGVRIALRTNRWTGETDSLGVKGWHVVQTPDEWNKLHWSQTHPLPLPEPLPVATAPAREFSDPVATADLKDMDTVTSQYPAGMEPLKNPPTPIFKDGRWSCIIGFIPVANKHELHTGNPNFVHCVIGDD
jgi:hypothetical protein